MSDFKISRIPVYLQNMPQRIREKGIGRYTSLVLELLGIKTSTRLKMIRFFKIVFMPLLYFKSLNTAQYTKHVPHLEIPKNEHELALPVEELQGLKELVSHCHDYFENNKKRIIDNFIPPYSLLIKPLINDKDVLSDEQAELIAPIIKFASQPKLMGLAAKYLGQIPAISNATLMYTMPMEKDASPVRAQKFHRDTQDSKLLHLVIPIHDIAENNGPFTYLDAKTSMKIAKDLNHEGGRVEDEVIQKYVKPENYKKLIGKAGESAWFLNPYYCFHHGARVQEGHRLMLIMTYVTPHESVEGLASFYQPKYRNKLAQNDLSQSEKHLLKLY